jgi:hypothetical protein
MGISRDYEAALAAVRTPYSNGMVEGTVNRPENQSDYLEKISCTYHHMTNDAVACYRC